ncbi:MAG: response regulator [Endomicrobiales bacterium]|nr:response regulator [Endomicrobiales bacterium]
MSKKVLIVDDEKDVLIILTDALSKEGYEIITASDGMEALEKVSSEKPDVILLDIMMPKLDGHSVNLKLKENPKTANIPVIVITAYGHLKKLLEVREELPVSGYLEKPFPIVRLKEKIREVLSGQGRK